MIRPAMILAMFSLALIPARAGSINIQIVESGQPNATKSYSVPDGDIDRIVAAHQQAANIAVNGTATRAQVLLTWVQRFMDGTKTTVSTFEKQQAVSAVPDPVPINTQ